MIYVIPEQMVVPTLLHSKAQHIVSIRNAPTERDPLTDPPWAGAVWATRVQSLVERREITHFKSCVAARFDDVQEDKPLFGYIAPTKADLEQILSASASFQKDAVLIVHCAAGYSRSAAVAVALSVQREPSNIRNALALLVGRLSQAEDKGFRRGPIRPHETLIRYADELLGCKGDLVRMVSQIRWDAETKNHVARSQLVEELQSGFRFLPM